MINPHRIESTPENDIVQADYNNTVQIFRRWHEWLDEFENKTDNYTELVQNIFCCFNDKDLLRSVVVNKSKCKKLPQYNKE